MKRKIVAVVLFLIILTGCAEENSSKVSTGKDTSTKSNISSSIEDDMVDVYVGDSMFITTLNDIYTNFNNYEGKSIEIEGFALKYDDHYFVGRYGPGCCSNDAIAFLPIEYSGDMEIKYADGWITTGVVDTKASWIKVTGTLEQRSEEEGTYYYINVSDVVIKDKWGREQVFQ